MFVELFCASALINLDSIEYDTYLPPLKVALLHGTIKPTVKRLEG